MPLAPMLAAALAVSEAFSFVRTGNSAIGRRPVGMSLWTPSQSVNWFEPADSEPTLRYLGIGPTIDPEPPVLVERRDPTDRGARRQNDSGPIVTFVADGPPGTVPDLHGMSAREAVRKLVELGLTAHLSGDGFVMSQDPPAGAVLESGAVCSLVLNRWVAKDESVVKP